MGKHRYSLKELAGIRRQIKERELITHHNGPSQAHADEKPGMSMGEFLQGAPEDWVQKMHVGVFNVIMIYGGKAEAEIFRAKMGLADEKAWHYYLLDRVRGRLRLRPNLRRWVHDSFEAAFQRNFSFPNSTPVLVADDRRL